MTANLILWNYKPMKYFNDIFDAFLYEGIFIFLFSSLLYLLDDRYTTLFFSISITSFIVAAVLGVLGYTFKLFTKEEISEEN